MKNKRIIFTAFALLISIFFFIQIGCDKDIVDDETPPTIILDTVIYISADSVIFNGDVTDNGSSPLTKKGFYWSNTQNPGEDNHIGSTEITGSSIGQFSDTVGGFVPQIPYYVIAYAINGDGTGYSEAAPFIMSDGVLPVVTIDSVTNITDTSAKFHGNVFYEGITNVSERGFCWNTTGNPDLNDTYINVDSGVGYFEKEITGLSENEDYYVAAYAKNDAGTSISLYEISFGTHLSINVTFEVDMNDVAIFDPDHDKIYMSGDYLTETPWPIPGSTSELQMLDNDEDGIYSATIELEDPLTVQYQYFRVINDIPGWENGEYVDTTHHRLHIIEEETTISNLWAACPDVEIKTYEEQDYRTVQIGDQCWFRKNLNVGEMVSGDINQTANGIPEKYCYDNIEVLCDVFGGLYQWDEMMQYTNDTNSYGICPEGWHIPTDYEWKILAGTVDSQFPVGAPEWDSTGLRGFDVGLNLKSINGWSEEGNGSDIFNFTALPTGVRDVNGNFAELGYHTYIYTSTEFQSGSDNAWRWQLNYDLDKINRNSYSKETGRSVRCIKDE